MIKRDAQEKSERNRAIYEERKKGLKFREIANRYGISTDRAREIYLKELRREESINKKRLYAAAYDVFRLKCMLAEYRQAEIFKGRQITQEDETVIEKITSLKEVYEADL